MGRGLSLLFLLVPLMIGGYLLTAQMNSPTATYWKHSPGMFY